MFFEHELQIARIYFYLHVFVLFEIFVFVYITTIILFEHELHESHEYKFTYTHSCYS